MAATYCVGPVERELRGLKTITDRTLRAICQRQPTTCDRTDCSPGGCRRHVVEFCTGVAARAGITTKGK